MAARQQQVTITLGRTGQVVKRERSAVDASTSSYDPSSSEGKRSVRERLGSNLVTHHENQHSKRQRTDNYNLNNNHMNDERNHTSHILNIDRFSRNDLRHKLMSKGLSRSKSGSEKQNGIDLREKLSRSSHTPRIYNSKQNLQEPSFHAIARRGLPPARSADDLIRLDSFGKSKASFASDGQKRRSPDRLLGAYLRASSPPRSYGDIRNAPLIRPYDESRLTTSHVTRSIAETSRPTAYASKGMATDAANIVLRPPPNVVQKPSYLSEEPLTVSGLMHSLGLGKYNIHFQAEEVDMAALRQMGDHDLKELGIPMGPRKKILLALLQRSKHPPR